MPTEGRVGDSLDANPPVLEGGDMFINDNTEIVIYEDQVLIDSGASDSMVPSFKYLDYITPCYATILLADGAMHNSDFQGLMHVQVTDLNTSKRMVIPVMNTLLVPGNATILWAVSGLVMKLFLDSVQSPFACMQMETVLNPKITSLSDSDICSF